MPPRNEEYDWIFDYVLQFLESDKFDAAVMNFVDEKCFLFDEEDENKLIYTDIHREFCDSIEALISSTLAEVGITTEQFVESCEKARQGRDINVNVFERLIALDDFQTFKKIMTKRNTELQLEAIRTFKASAKAGPPSVEEIEKYFNDDELVAFDDMSEEEIQELLFQSLVDMEFVHRQQELEHAELERALMLSLVAEEERVREMIMDMKATIDEIEDKPQSKETFTPSEEKVVESKQTIAETSKQEVESSKQEAAPIEQSVPKTKHISPMKPINQNLDPNLFADVKPLKVRGELKPLPSIHNTQANDPVALSKELTEKKKITEEVIKKSQQQLQGQRQNEEDLRSKLTQLDDEEVARRAKHMQEQRELLVAKKKAEREKKVRMEEERQAKMKDEQEERAPLSPSKAKTDAEDFADMRRSTMRMALARHLKMNIETSIDAKHVEDQSNQFAVLDKKLQEVEAMREENRRKELLLQRQLRKQQEQIASNIENSAEKLR